MTTKSSNQLLTLQLNHLNNYRVRYICTPKHPAWDTIKEKLSDLVSDMLSFINSDDVDLLWNQLTSYILYLIDEYIPNKTTRKHCSLPWITSHGLLKEETSCIIDIEYLTLMISWIDLS